ncbi:sterol desaturase/sphingolipid hydroxylase (fatty acid hydroxylase superfamily) [Chryseobacterium defluvii]|uniref:Sterol desaturase/sphingolipid hydroxylase (Fatty acid hydroxylase superfamily) n=1 Tax=Chryseobacterium defluvii TaxID=160396 RepID=A0A840KFG2_9FLAO|nr:sterol desaturase family protein [Chryseobacterium defluvii]MBB4808309.1 sterol desaturase/sphingolipid hydroxylase (fatty acid hydroxylase superfamily) [Chryseobacterium defluvii]
MKQLFEELLSVFSLERAGIYLGVLFICLVLEIIFIGWENCSLKKIINLKSNTVKLDIFSYIFKVSNFIEILGFIFSFGLSYVIADILGMPKTNYLQEYIGNIFIQNIIFILILDFSLYWIHRFLHMFHFLWEIHKFHHSAEEMTIFTTARLHPLEIAINSIVFSIPIYLIGVPAESYIFFIIFTSWLGHIQHSNLSWNFGFIGKWLFISPNSHRIHHSTSKEHFNKNFGTVTPIWDRLFGTWYELEGESKKIEIGVSQDYHNLSSNIFRSYFLSFKGLFLKILNKNENIRTK